MSATCCTPHTVVAQVQRVPHHLHDRTTTRQRPHGSSLAWWRRRRLAAAAAAPDEPLGQQQQDQHFLRPSLLASGLTEAPDVVQHCLALCRKADLAGLQQYLPPDTISSSSTSSSSNGTEDRSAGAAPWGLFTPEEQGPLVSLAAGGLLDVGARRVLPGHLLRRSQVLSTLRLGDTFQQRTALTACTGETSVFTWQLQWRGEGEGAQDEDEEEGGGDDRGSASSSSSSSSSNSDSSRRRGGGGRWVLTSVRRDAAASDLPLPTTPHPKASPEAIVRAQLAALAGGDLLGASCFSMWPPQGGSGGGGSGGRGSSRRTSLAFHHDALRTQLAQPPYDSLLLLGAAGAAVVEVRLGAAALPTQRQQLQEVELVGLEGGGSGTTRFVWRLGMAAHGCWMTDGIFAAEDGLGLREGE